MQKTKIALLIIALLPLIAAELQIEQINRGSTIIAELENPALFDLKITNTGQTDKFEIYSLLSIDFWPKGFFQIPEGTKTIEIRAIPAKELREKNGPLRFDYEIRGTKTEISKDSLTLTIVPLQDVLQITAQPLNPEDQHAEITIQNKENTHIENLDIRFESVFFENRQKISLTPFQIKKIQLPLTKPTDRISAGPYIVLAEIPLQDKTITKETTIDFLEKEGTAVTTDTSGIVIQKTTTTKTNYGNIPINTEIEIQKNIISRIVTQSTPAPQTEQRDGLTIHYTWQKNLQPGETLSVTATTNYTIPFILLLIIIASAILVRIHTLKKITLVKKTSFVKTKHGEFALKITLNIKAQKNLANINIIDRLPHMTKLYEKYGKKPDKIDPKTKRLFWHIPKMEKGEKRLISYVIYSKMNILGRFELPHALATFKHENKLKEVLSNKAYFVASD